MRRVCLAEKCKVPKMKAGNSPERGISRRAEIGTGRTGAFGRAPGRRGLTCRLCGPYLCGRPACRSVAGICRTRCIGRHRSPAVHGPSARWPLRGRASPAGRRDFGAEPRVDRQGHYRAGRISRICCSRTFFGCMPVTIRGLPSVGMKSSVGIERMPNTAASSCSLSTSIL